MAIVFRVLGDKEARKFLAASSRRAKDLRPALEDIGEEMLSRTQNRLAAGTDVQGKPFKRSRRGGQTLWDSGSLAASVSYSLYGRAALDLFSTSPYARVHNEGLTIVPKNAKFLTIPLRAKGGNYEAKGATHSANRRGTRARHFKNTFFLRRGGKLFLMQREKGGPLRALFILLRSVKMPRREWFGFSSGDQQMVTETIESHVTGDGK